MKSYDRPWHPSYGYFTRDEVNTLNAMRDGEEYKTKRKELDKESARCLRRAEKKAKEIPFPPLKVALAIAALLSLAAPAQAENNATLICGAGEFRAVRVKGYEVQGTSLTAQLEVSCERLPVPQPQQHPTLVQNAPPIDEKIINLEEQ